jgi:hypothetical protein
MSFLSVSATSLPRRINGGILLICDRRPPAVMDQPASTKQPGARLFKAARHQT